MNNLNVVQVGENLKSSIIEALSGLGGISNFVKPAETVLLKPNFNTADIPPGSTDLDFLQTVVEIVYEAGAERVIIADSCTFMLKTSNVMEKKNIYSIQKAFPKTEVFDLTKGKWIKTEIPNAKFLKSVSIPEILNNVDKVIFLPCLKTHFMAQFTGSIKLSVGLMKPVERLSLHMSHLQEKIAELASLFKPDLIIMDGRKCFIDGGPGTGTVREPNLILASTSRIELDKQAIRTIQSFEGNSLAGIVPEDLPQIKHAIEMGVV